LGWMGWGGRRVGWDRIREGRRVWGGCLGEEDGFGERFGFGGGDGLGREMG